MSYYVVSNGYRIVIPYLHISKLKVKDSGVKAIEVILQKYFLPHHAAVVENDIRQGRVQCNNQVLQSPDKLVYKNDVLSYTWHWHETEVLANDINVLHLSEEVVVVNKPASIPVHPTGNFRMNTIQNILKYDHPSLLGHEDFTYVHRIDRLTSGVLIFARTPAAIKKLCRQFQQHAIDKEYLARVKGTFPAGVIEVNKPIARLQNYPPLYGTTPEGKPSRTLFERLSVSPDGSESIVCCKPITGRTHQIRVHLKWLGHPIANDHKYGGDLSLGSYDKPVPVLQDYPKVSWCSECVSGHRDTSHVTKEDLRATCIWLHAMRYSNPHPKQEWTFEAPLPAWSQFGQHVD